MSENPLQYGRQRGRQPFVESPTTSSSSSSAAAAASSFDLSDLRTKYSSDEFDYPSGYSPPPGSAYAWDINQARPVRSLSTISVMTAEPIDYDCSKEIDFKPSQESVSHSTLSSSSAASTSYGTSANTAIAPKQLLPGNPNLPTGDYKSRYDLCDLAAVESVIHQIRLQKDPPSFYHFMDLNPGPVDMVPRLSNVPSQYQLHDMYEFSALQTSDAMAKLYDRACAKGATSKFDQSDVEYLHGNGGGGGDAGAATFGQVNSEYYTEA